MEKFAVDLDKLLDDLENDGRRSSGCSHIQRSKMFQPPSYVLKDASETIIKEQISVLAVGSARRPSVGREVLCDFGRFFASSVW